MVESPCNKICITNKEDICLGCGRNLEEIAKWIDFNDAQKDECIRKSRERLVQLMKNSS
ncbi:MAG TPA: DUF1289 domain-containing protein [Candidatus Nanoarchaeia archaeon]|nr:DUF1289 domain-containing protein [Candidatus Nanoarchaeia archaeon]